MPPAPSFSVGSHVGSFRVASAFTSKVLALSWLVMRAFTPRQVIPEKRRKVVSRPFRPIQSI